MPIFRNKITAGSQFTGADADTGLFQPASLPGGSGQPYKPVRIRSLKFHTTNDVTTWTLAEVDPTDSGNAPVLLTATSDDLQIHGFVLPREDDGSPWGLKFTTANMNADGWLTIFYDYEEPAR